MHLVGWLRGALTESDAATRAAAVDVVVHPLSSFSLVTQPRPALVLGYAGVRPSLIWRGARLLGAVLRRASP
jgi:GntR family transcriptional regulator/MocR family aminotransferase